MSNWKQNTREWTANYKRDLRERDAAYKAQNAARAERNALLRSGGFFWKKSWIEDSSDPRDGEEYWMLLDGEGREWSVKDALAAIQNKQTAAARAESEKAAVEQARKDAAKAAGICIYCRDGSHGNHWKISKADAAACTCKTCKSCYRCRASQHNLCTHATDAGPCECEQCRPTEPTGAALTVAAPEVVVEMTPTPKTTKRVVTPLPTGYAVAQNEAGRFVIVHAGQVMTRVLKSGEIRLRTYAHKSSARRFIRTHAAC